MYHVLCIDHQQRALPTGGCISVVLKIVPTFRILKSTPVCFPRLIVEFIFFAQFAVFTRIPHFPGELVTGDLNHYRIFGGIAFVFEPEAQTKDNQYGQEDGRNGRPDQFQFSIMPGNRMICVIAFLVFIGEPEQQYRVMMNTTCR